MLQPLTSNLVCPLVAPPNSLPILSPSRSSLKAIPCPQPRKHNFPLKAHQARHCRARLAPRYRKLICHDWTGLYASGTRRRN